MHLHEHVCMHIFDYLYCPFYLPCCSVSVANVLLMCFFTCLCCSVLYLSPFTYMLSSTLLTLLTLFHFRAVVSFTVLPSGWNQWAVIFIIIILVIIFTFLLQAGISGP